MGNFFSQVYNTERIVFMLEMAMLLPASFGASRRMNDSHDIRKNLRFRNAELAQQHSQDNKNEWEFNLK